jgi:hypothetical protein
VVLTAHISTIGTGYNMQADHKGTVIIKSTDNEMELYISNDLTKAQTLQILLECLHVIRHTDIDDDDAIAFETGNAIH